MLVSHDGIEWDWPAGRTEGDETWELTLRREILEEVCATVVDARLLGFCRSVCIAGREADLVLVRSFWRARVVPGSGGGVVFRQVFRNAEYVAATDARTDARGAFGWP
jgi:predicted NUDIX family NTP pyrophosphohydrolase